VNIFDTLTELELKISYGVMIGKSNKEIGNNLGIDENSIKQYISRICTKLGTRKRSKFLPIFIDSLDIEDVGFPEFSGSVSPQFAYEMGFNKVKELVLNVVGSD
jgi:DNA-binding CsgD family transcriptional regulator